MATPSPSPAALGLDLVNADGTNYRQNVVVFPTIITYSEYTYKPRPQWSADGAYFTVAIPSADPLAADPSFTVYRISVDGAVTPLANQPGNIVFGGAIAPQIAPDGQHLVYSAGQSDGSGDVLHMLALLGDAVGDNSFDSQMGPIGLGWSPDSQNYVYAVTPPGGINGYIIGLSRPIGPGAHPQPTGYPELALARRQPSGFHRQRRRRWVVALPPNAGRGAHAAGGRIDQLGEARRAANSSPTARPLASSPGTRMASRKTVTAGRAATTVPVFG